MGFLASPVLWSFPARMIAYWATTFVVTFLIESNVAPMPLRDMVSVLAEAAGGSIERLGSREFAFSLAAVILSLAAGLAVAHLICHVVLVTAALGPVTRRIRSLAPARGGPGFFAARRQLAVEFGRHPIIGSGWKVFDDTLVRPEHPDEPLSYTVRPQTILNVALARDRLMGLKMMPSLPGYFVGIGLLLTFVGLVLALNEAAAGTTSNDTQAMRIATSRLLQVATFKFATSIAGLGASIALSMLFRAYAIAVEGAFDRLCRTIEDGLQFRAPQSLTLEMTRIQTAQLAELRELNGEAFHERLAVAVAPPLQLAMREAIEPLTLAIQETADRLDTQSRTGIEDLLERFLESMRGGAGTELRELGGLLKTLQETLAATQQGLAGTGIDFSARINETADRLNGLIIQTGSVFGQSSEASRAQLADMVSAMQALFERAHGRIDADLATAAGGASARIEETMGRVLTQLEAQVEGLRAGLGGFQAGMAEQMAETRRRALDAQETALGMVDRASAAAAGVLEHGFQNVLVAITSEVDRMVQAMRLAEAAMVTQAGAVKEAVGQSKSVADAFGRTADLVRTAAAPLLQTSDRLAGASERMAETMGRSVAALDESQKAAKRLSDTISGHIDRLNLVWHEYEARFGKVDEDLGRALARLAEETRRQLDVLAEHTEAIDRGLAAAVDRLSGHVAGLSEGAGDLAESVGVLKETLAPRQGG
ncbi:MAG: anti-phage ZorAB system protein ZorA [Ancalomicrobiaceae bacterium]|nr:anti-phage ZorAB system protein ZorA [Ancalomicrobiaceae bacterium]